MLDKKITGIEYDESGKFYGVRCEEGLYRADKVIGDPSYFPNRVQKTGQVIRAICFLKAPVPNTSGSDSVQIIIPQRQVKRRYGKFKFYFLVHYLYLYLDHRYLRCSGWIFASSLPRRHVCCLCKHGCRDGFSFG